MRQKLLLFISIVLLFTLNKQAESDVNLPALPMDSIIGNEDKKNDSDLSFWQKTKGFFGFGSEENIENTSENDVQEDNLNTDLTVNDIPPLPVEDLEEGPSIEQNDKPIAPAEELNPVSKQSVDLGVSDEIDGEALSIPTGFEDEDGELKLPSGFSENDVEPKEDLSIPEKADEPINSKDIPTILTEKKKDLSDDTKEKIEATMEAIKIPDVLDDKEANIETSKNPSSEAPKNIIESNKEEAPKAPEILNTEVQTSPPVVEENAKKDDQIMLPELDSSEDLAPKTESIAKEALPAPTYASTPEVPKEPETSVSKFTKTFESRKSNQIELPKITEEDFIANDDGEAIKQESIELDSKQLQFVNNEAQVLILPNDDVVLGRLTKQARINDMDLHEYKKRFWKNYDMLKREPKREEIEQFIENYDENFNEEDFL